MLNVSSSSAIHPLIPLPFIPLPFPVPPAEEDGGWKVEDGRNAEAQRTRRGQPGFILKSERSGGVETNLTQRRKAEEGCGGP